jgi:hypothetical protein
MTINISKNNSKRLLMPVLLAWALMTSSFAQKPVISVQPKDTAGCEKSYVSISVSTGDITDTLRWEKENGGIFENITASEYSGQASPTLTIGHLTLALNDTRYRCVLKNNGDSTISDTVTLTVRAAPVASIIGNATFCEKDALILSASPSSMSYRWAGPSGFTSTDETPLVASHATIAMAGTYSVSITNSNGCSDTANLDVTVHAAPVASISGNGEVCEKDAVLLSASPLSMSYSWSGPLGFTSTSVSPVIAANATTAMTGSYVVIVTNSNSCKDTATLDLTVHSAPVASISGINTICEKEVLQLTASPSSMSYSWSGPSGFASSLFNPVISSHALAGMSGTYSVVVTNTNSCKDTATIDATVNAAPVASISVNNPVCEKDTFRLKASPAGMSYNWSGPSGFANTSVNPMVSPHSVTGMSGSYSVIVTNTNSCADTATLNVTVHGAPVAAIIGNTSVCEKDAFQLTAFPASLYYNWSGPLGFNSTLVNPLIAMNATTAMTGPYAVVVTNANGCKDTASWDITVHAAPVASISGNSSVCEKDAFQLSASPASMSYNWTGPLAFNSTAVNPFITMNATTAMTGPYSVVVTNASNCKDTAILNVTVHGAPIASIIGNNSICEKDAFQLTASPASMSYNWTGPLGFSSTFVNPMIAMHATTTLTGTYTVVVTNASSCKDTSVIDVTVHTAPVASISGSSVICEKSALQLTASPASMNYNWSGPLGFISSLMNPLVSDNAVTAMTGPYRVVVTNSNSCRDTATFDVNVNAAPVALINGNSSICEKDAFQLIASPASMNYNWTGPQAFNSTLANPLISSHAVTNLSGSYTVIVTNSNSCKDTATLDVTVNAAPVASISGNSLVCESNALQLTASPASLNYNWSGPLGFNSTSVSPLISSHAVMAMSGNYTVVVSDGNSCKDTANTFVIVNLLPQLTLTGSDTICKNEQNVIYTTEAGFTNYVWSISGGNITGGGGVGDRFISITWNTAGNGYVNVNCTNFLNCSASVQKNVYVRALPNPSISSSNNAVCLNSEGNIYTTQPSMKKYLWTVYGGIITAGGDSTSNTVTVKWSTVGLGKVNVNYSNGCTSNTGGTYDVQVNSLPVPVISGPQSVCLDSAGCVYSSGNGMTNYSWSVEGGNITSGGTSTSPTATVTWNSPGNKSVMLNYSSNNCFATSPSVYNVTVKPHAIPSISGNASVCLNSENNIYTTESGMDNYIWSIYGGTITSGGMGLRSATVLWNSSGNRQISVNYENNGCKAVNPYVFNVLVNTLPTVSFYLPTLVDSAVPSIKMTNIFPKGGVFSGPGVVSIDSSFRPGYVMPGNTYSVLYTYTDGNGCTNNTSRNITVTAAKGTISGFSKSVYCLGDSPVGLKGYPGDGYGIPVGFTGTGILSLGRDTATFIPSIAGSGNHNIVFTFKKVLSINSPNDTVFTYLTVSRLVQVETISKVDFFGLEPSYCFKEGFKDTLRAYPVIPAGGIFSYNGIWPSPVIGPVGTFNLDSVGFGPKSVTLQYTSINGCKRDTTKGFIVKALPYLSFALQKTYNSSNDPIVLRGNIIGGKFFGKGIVNDTLFVPSLAGSGEIFITYQAESDGCSASLTKSTYVFSSSGQIFPSKEIFCFGETPTLLTAVSNGLPGGIFSGPGVTNTGIDSAIFNVNLLNKGDYTIHYVYKDSVGTSYIIEKKVYVDSIPSLSMVNIQNQQEICKNASSFVLLGLPAGGVFLGKGVTNENTFNPSVLDVGSDTVVYFYSSSKGCTKKISAKVYINEVPQVDFSVQNNCINLAKPDSVQFLNRSTTATDEITQWRWGFDDELATESNNRSFLKDPKHLYRTASSRDIQLEAITEKGCIANKTTRVYFGDIPVADFYWTNECFTSTTPFNFVNSTTCNGLITDYRWNFMVNEVAESIDTKDVTLTFPALSDYNVELWVRSQYGCEDTVSKVIHLKPTISIGEDGYYEDFENGGGGWASLPVSNTTDNWRLGFFSNSGSTSNTRSWFTYIQDHSLAEQSAVISPCLDMRQLDKPMIKFKMQKAFEENHDGGVLQYSINNGIDWFDAGNVNEGLNWFNSDNIVVKPGNQTIGWTGIANKPKDSTWIDTRHDLNFLKGRPNVRLRFAYASNGSSLISQGYAFDDVWIGDRSRIALMEHFTNSSDQSSVEADQVVNTLENSYNGEVIVVQYHTKYPEGDTMYLNYPSGPAVRSILYGYGLPPYSMLDGLSRFDYRFTQVDNNLLNRRILTDPLFKIDISCTNDNNLLNIKANVMALDTVPFKEMKLHVAVVEKEITGILGQNGEDRFENVVKGLVPDASGTSISRSWSKGQTQQVNLSWVPRAYDPSKLAVVAFIQDEGTQEVYQAKRFDQVPYIQSVAEEKETILKPLVIKVYPNPSEGRVCITFSEELKESARLCIYNNYGVLIATNEINTGAKELYIDLSANPAGIYIIKVLSASNGLFGSCRVSIIP